MADVIDVRDLEEKEIELLETLVESLKEKARKKKSVEAREKKDGFKRSAGAWKGLIDPEELIANIYASRLVSTRPEVKL
jgi:hypothetical protein